MKLLQTIQNRKDILLKRALCRLFAAWSFYILSTLGIEADFISLGFNQNTYWWVPVLWIFIGFVIISAVSLLLPQFNIDSWFLLLGSGACVILWCISYPWGINRTFFWLAVGTVCSLILIWVLYENEALLDKLRVSKKSVIIWGAALAVFSCAVIALVTCLRYKTFSSPNFDFGIFVNMFHNMKETGLPLTTCERDTLLSHFAVHISPIYYLILPFYVIFPSPYTLQIAQAVIVALGVIPIILLARHYKLSSITTIVVSALYAFYTASSTGCFYDIHENCFLLPLLLFTFLFFEKGKTVPMYLCVLLTLGVKEDAAIYLIIFALYAILSRRKFLHGTIIAAVSVAYFIGAVMILESQGLGIMSYRYSNFIYNAEDGLLGAVKTVLLNPGYLLTQLFSTSKGEYDKLVYLLKLLLPLGFIPLFTKKISRWILLAPLLLNMLTMYVYQYDISFQYNFGITAFLFYATIQNSADISPNLRKSIFGVAVAFCICLYTVTVVPELIYFAEGSAQYNERHERLEEVLDMVPSDASVACSTYFVAHIADRSEIYEIETHEGKCDIDYVVLDMQSAEYTELLTHYIMSGYTEYFAEEGMIVILQSPELSKK